MVSVFPLLWAGRIITNQPTASCLHSPLKRQNLPAKTQPSWAEGTGPHPGSELEGAKWKLSTQIQLQIDLPSTQTVSMLLDCGEKEGKWNIPWLYLLHLQLLTSTARALPKVPHQRDTPHTALKLMNTEGQADILKFRHAQVTLLTAHKKPAWATSVQIVKKQLHKLTEVSPSADWGSHLVLNSLWKDTKPSNPKPEAVNNCWKACRAQRGENPSQPV